LCDELDLGELVLRLPDAQYNPKSFPGLILRIDDPRTTNLLFRSGKMVCTGGKTHDEARSAVARVMGLLRNAGAMIYGSPAVEVQNLVVTANLGQEIDLIAATVSLGLERAEYEPEVFPGLVYRLEEPRVVMLIFGSGRLVCTGAHTPLDATAAVDKLVEQLCSAGLLSGA
jgi:transcription initiation factor TFIID TATA-box-binding protein